METLFRKCSVGDLMVLRAFAKSIYYETFQGMSSPEYMDAYLNQAFDPERLRGEL